MALKFVAFVASCVAIVATVNAGILPLHHQHELAFEQQQPAVYHSVAAPAPVHVTHHAPAPQHVLLHHQQQHQPQQHEQYQYPDDPHPQYNFAYDVQDTVSGDSKSQSESRDGDVVHGEYSLNDADGFRRIVKYTADSLHGFNAVVQREPLTHQIVAAPVHQQHVPAAYAHVIPAPAAKPIAYAAPKYTTVHAAQNDYAGYESSEYYHH